MLLTQHVAVMSATPFAVVFFLCHNPSLCRQVGMSIYACILCQSREEHENVRLEGKKIIEECPEHF